jgi:hypothetical protein
LLVDQFVGGREERFWHLDAERFGGLKADGELELGRLHDRQVGGLGAFEDLTRIDADLPVSGVLRSSPRAHGRPMALRAVMGQLLKNCDVAQDAWPLRQRVEQGPGLL